MNHNAESFRTVQTGIDVQPLIDRLAEVPGLWEKETWRQEFPGTAHHDTKSIMLRMPEQTTPQSILYGLDAYETGEIFELPQVFGLLKTILEATDADEIGRVMLVKLPPDGTIDMHNDEGGYADYYDRFHLVVDAEPGNVMSCGVDVLDSPEPGTLFWFNHKKLHSAMNNSKADRIHLIVDLVTPAYREARYGSGISMQREAIHALWPELNPLTQDHWREIAHYQDIELNPDMETYQACEEAGLLRFFTVRDDGRLVGYAAFTVKGNIHYAQSKQAVQDVLFIHPDYRKGNIGRALIQNADAYLRQEGVQVVYHHVKFTHDFGPLLESEGYEAIETIWGKRLDLEA